MVVRIAESADVDERAQVGDGTSVWHLAQIREHAVLGENCVVGRGSYVGSGARIGNNCKIQNYALVYEPAVLGDGVFIGPAVVLTNDTYPRAVTPEGEPKTASDWQSVGVIVGEGAAIGARAVCVAPLAIGAWAMVAAGAVVTTDVPAHALVAGVPARQVGWVGKSGRRLAMADESIWVCPESGMEYHESGGALRPVQSRKSSI